MNENLKHHKRMMVHRNRLLALLTLFLLICGIIFIQVKANEATLADSQKILQEKNSKLEKVQKNKEHLKIVVKELKDEKYIKKWLRSKSFYSKDGEIIYNFGSK